MIISNDYLFQPRASHSAVLENNNIWIFGGYTFTNKESSNQLIRLDLINLKYYKNDLKIVPEPRYDHSMVYYKVIFKLIKLYLFYYYLKF